MFDILRARIKASPSAEAVVWREERWTYGELGERTLLLARRLVDAGVEPGDRVAICAARSSQLVAALLAVLDVGAAFVPLDPSYPPAYLRMIALDAHPVVMLVDHPIAELDDLKIQQVVLGATTVHAGLVRDPEHPRNPEEAYVMYTSGSTGQPRGVVLGRSALEAYIAAINEVIQAGPGTRYLHTASFSVSSSVRQLMVPLAHGGTAVLAATEDVRDPLKLLSLVRVEGVTMIDTVPSYWRACIHALEQLSEVRRKEVTDNALQSIHTTGEPLPWSTPVAWRRLVGAGHRLLNMYGQTETTGSVASYAIPPTRGDESGIVPIGRPLPGIEIHLLDDALTSVSDGEICVTGPTLGLGYMHPDRPGGGAFQDWQTGARTRRLYRTGDFGRLADDGTLLFAGRRDSQVKVRGQRVELLQIESVLASFPDASAVAVVAHPGADDSVDIVAHVAIDEASFNPSAIRAHVRRHLPDYMLPRVIERHDSLPRTRSGKIDRLALKRSVNMPPVARDPAPRKRSILAELEEELAAIWKEVIGVEELDIHANFFDLGGHSLMAIRIAARVQERLGVEVSVADLFNAPTVSEYAHRVLQAMAAAGGKGSG